METRPPGWHFPAPPVWETIAIVFTPRIFPAVGVYGYQEIVGSIGVFAESTRKGTALGLEDRSPGAQEGSKGLHEQHETHFVNRRWAEAEAEVEGARGGANRLHQESADTHSLGGLLSPQKRILQQSSSQTLSLLSLIDGEAS